MNSATVTLASLLTAASLLSCSGSADNDSAATRSELERITAEKQALEAEVNQYGRTVERLESEIRSIYAENAELKDQLESTSLELEAAKSARPVEFVERVVEKPASRAGSTSANTGLPTNPVDESTGLQVLKALARATERNNSWWRFGWAVTIANHSSETIDFRLIVQFMDVDGFVVDDDTEHGLTIPPRQTKTFRESALVDVSVARKVKSVNPVIKY